MRLVTYIVQPRSLRISTLLQPPGRLGWMIGEKVMDAELARYLPGFQEGWAKAVQPSKPFWPATLEQYLHLSPFMRATWLRFLEEFSVHYEPEDKVEGEPVILEREEVDLLPPWSLRMIQWQSNSSEAEDTEGEGSASMLVHPVLVGCQADPPLLVLDKIRVDVGIAAAMAKAGPSAPVSTLGGYTLWAALRTQHLSDHLCLGSWLTTDASLPDTLDWDVTVQGQEIASAQENLFSCLDSLQSIRTTAWEVGQADVGDAVGVRWLTFFVDPEDEWAFRVQGLGVLSPRLASKVAVDG